jgi:type III secretory pathway component EscV
LIRGLKFGEGTLAPATEGQEKTWDRLVEHLEGIVRLRAVEFYGPQDVSKSLKAVKMDSLLPIPQLTLILKGLLLERVPLARFKTIIDSLNNASTGKLSVAKAQELVRQTPSIREDLPGNSLPAQYRFRRVSDQLDLEIAGCVDQGWPEAVFTANIVKVGQWLMAFRTGLGDASQTDHVAVLCSAQSRPYVRALIQAEFRDIPVLSAQATACGPSGS